MITGLRYIFSPPAEACLNMALDEVFLDGVTRGEAPPTLRLYSWRPPGITLGYFQPGGMVDEAACRRRGVEVVRRITGGGAVLHYGDVTGCLVAPLGLLPAGVRDSYRLLSSLHAAALRELGLAAEVGAEAAPLPRRLRPGYDCFARLTECDVAAGGRKIAGGAQRRKNGALLHHSSLVWDPQPVGLLGELLPGAAALGDPPAVLDLVPDARREAFGGILARLTAEALGLALISGDPTPAEDAAARELAAVKQLQPY